MDRVSPTPTRNAGDHAPQGRAQTWIRARLAAALVLPIILLASLITTAVLIHASLLAREHDQVQAQRTALLVADVVARAAETYRSPAGLRDYLTQLAADKLVDNIVVAVGRPATVLLSTEPEQTGRQLGRVRDTALATHMLAVARETAGEGISVAGSDPRLFAQRIQLQSPAPGLGDLRDAVIGIRLDPASFHQLELDLLLAFIGWTVAGVSLAVWVFLRILRRRVFAPLDAIESAMQQRRGGQRAARVAISADDELGDLAAEINKAFDAIDVRDEQNRVIRQEIVSALTRSQQDLAFDLHDHVGGDLGGLAFRAKTLAQRLRAGGRPETALAEELTTALSAVATRTRALSRLLAPTSAEQGGLPMALARLCQSARAYSESHSEVTLRLGDDLPVLEAWQANHVYLIAQEALRNAIQHASPSRIHVTLARRAGALMLRITSNQRPWDPEAHQSGLGMRILRFRAETLNAALSIHVRPGGVTQVRLLVPTAA